MTGGKIKSLSSVRSVQVWKGCWSCSALTSSALPQKLLFDRRTALAVSVAIHLAIVALLFLEAVDQPRQRPERGLSVIAVMSDRDVQAKPQLLAEKPKVDVTPQPSQSAFLVEMPMVAQEAASSGSDGPACAVPAAVQADLMTSEAARAELAAIPFESRSVANAIVLWTGTAEHVRPELPITDALIRQRLESLPTPCLDLDQTGPDLIYATVETRTVAIAIGSGKWRWRTFLDFLSSSVRPSSDPKRISAAPDN